MAFSGHTDSDGKVVWREELYTGRTTIIGETLSSPSDQSEQSEASDKSEKNYLPPQRWQNLNLLERNSLLYRDQGESSSSSSAPLSLPPAQDSIYIDGKYNSDSIYSWTDMYGSLKQAESQNNVVPSLDLQSKTSTLDYLRDLDGLKLKREPQKAYESWYEFKQRLRQQELQRHKEKRERKQLEDDERKKLAKICYEKWLSDKTKATAQKRLQNRVQSTASQKSSAVISCSSENKTLRNVSQSEISQVVESWWHKKQEQQQRQRLEKQRHIQKKEWETLKRKQLASMAWQKWMSNVYDKPKPVPMNQGIDSLRGTVSQIYINPVPWKPLKKSSEKL